MKKSYGYSRSNSQLELIMVLTLLLLFGFTIFQLIITGSEAQKNISQNKDEMMDARVAVSFVDIRLRQADGWGRMDIIPLENGRNALRLKEYYTDTDYFYRWIYFEDGALREQITEEGDTFYPAYGTAVVSALDFNAEFNEDNTGVYTTYHYIYSGREEAVDSFYYLRSNAGNHDLQEAQYEQ